MTVANDAYHDLTTRILLASRRSTGATLGITSARPGEGKTTTVLNLARSFAEDQRVIGPDDTAQKVLIVDCNAGHVRSAQELQVPEAPGLTEYLSNSCALSEIVKETAVLHLSIAPVGAHPEMLPALLRNRGMLDPVAGVRNQFSLVLFDLPALLTGAEAQAMTGFVDHLLLVVRAGKVSQRQVTQALELIDRSKLLGTVLNERRRTLPSWLEQRV